MRLPLAATPLMLLLTASVPAQQPDMVEAGRVMATLNDWRAILFAALVLGGALLTGLLGTVFGAFRVMTKGAEANGRLADALAANNATMSRIESMFARWDAERDRPC